MSRFLHRALAAALAVFVSACSYDLSLPERPQIGTLTGTVDTGGHISPKDLTVELVDENGSRQSQKTSETGAFSFSAVLPSRTYYLELNAPGFAPLLRPNIRVGGAKTLDLGTLTPVWLQGTASEGTIAGKIQVGNGSASPAGAFVHFVLEGPNERVATVNVDGSGEFAQRVPPGTYTVEATHPLYVSNRATGVVVAAAERRDLTATPIILDINPATLTGTVNQEVDRSQPVAANGATVTLEDGTTTTVSSGTFTFTGLAAGARTFKVTLANHHDLVETRSVTLEPGRTTTLALITLARDRGAIEGTVVTGDNRPIKDAIVSVSGTSYSAIVAGNGQSSGSFRISGVPTGTHDLTAFQTGYLPVQQSGVVVAKNLTTVVAAPLTLPVQTGNFLVIDDDPNNSAGFTRDAGVTLQFTGALNAVEVKFAEEARFADAGFEAFTAQKTLTLVGPDGPRTLLAQYKDSSGVLSEVLSASIILDTVPPQAPTVSLNGGADFTATANPLAVTLVASDATSGLRQVQIADSAAGLSTATKVVYQRDTTHVRASSADAVAEVHARFIDHAGNVSAVAMDSIVVDTVAPTGSISIADGPKATAPGYTHLPFVQLTATAAAEPNGGAVLIRVANSSSALTTALFHPLQGQGSATHALDAFSDGSKTVFAQLQDSAGNRSTVLTATIIYDSTPPSPASVALVTPRYTNQATATLSLSATDLNGLAAASGVTVALDPGFSGATVVGPAAMPTGGTLSLTLPSEGDHVAYVRYRDVAGNEAFVSTPVTLDTTPPTGGLSLLGTLADGSRSAELTTSTTVDVTLAPTDARDFLLSLDGSLTACPATGYGPITQQTFSRTLGGAGATRKVQLCLMDRAGNIGALREATITVDSVAPSGCALALSGQRRTGETSSTHTVNRTLPVSLTGCLEAPGEIAFTTSTIAGCDTATGLIWQAFSPSTSVNLPDVDAAYTVDACVRDAARRVEAVTEAALRLDRQAPSFTALNVTTPLPTNLANVAFSLSATDNAPLTNADALTFSTDSNFAGATPALFANSFSYDLAAFTGTFDVHVRVRDGAGNEAARTVPVTRDTTPPSGSVTIVGLLGDGSESTASTTTEGPLSVRLDAPGAASYAIANGATLDCSTAAYAGLPSPTITGWTLAGAGATRTVSVCLKDSAGNATLAPLGDSIGFDADAPAGCALTLYGRRAEGTDAGAAKSALANVLAVVSGCSGATEYYVTNGACSSTVSVGWLPYSGSSSSSAHSLSGTPGFNTVNLCARGAARNVATFSDTIELDQTPPTAYGLSIDSDDPYINAQEVVARGGSFGTVSGSASNAAEWSLVEGDGTATPPPFTSWQTFTGASVQHELQGTGSRPELLLAQFRDEVGNLSAVVADDILIDVDAPEWSGAPLSLVVPENNNRTSSPSVTVRAEAADGGAYITLAEDDGSSACNAFDLVGVAPRSAAGLLHPLVLSGGQGDKLLCAYWSDEAGNFSTVASQQVVLDQTPPGLPAMLTQGRTFNPEVPPNSINQTVEIAASSQATDHKEWQVLGGANYTLWTPQVPTAAGQRLQFSFTLSRDGGEEGALNVLSVRSVDTTGNASEGATVAIIADTVPPRPVQLSNAWVETASGTATAYWTDSAQGRSADTVGYNLYYASSGGDPDAGIPTRYTASYAAQGPSPFLVTQQFATLSGLPNGAATYVTVRAVDHAGNISSGPPLAPAEILLQPNVVSPDLIVKQKVMADAGSFMADTLKIDRVLVNEDIAYVSALEQGVGCNVNRRAVLRAVGLKSIDTAINGGVPNAAISGLELYEPQWFPANGAAIAICGGDDDFRTQLHLDGPYLYLAAGSILRIFEVMTDPKKPTPVAELDFVYLAADAGITFRATSNIFGFQVNGTNAFVTFTSTPGAVNVIHHLDLGRLYDGDPLTKPRLSDVKGTVTQAFNSRGITWSRNRLMGGLGIKEAFWDLSAALDDSTATNVSNASKLLDGGLGAGGNYEPVTMSGNYAFANTDDGVRVTAVEKLWTDTAPYCEAVVSVAVGARGQATLAGSHLFTHDFSTGAVRVVDFTDVEDPQFVGTTRLNGTLAAENSQWGQSVFGNYLLSGTAEGGVRVFEIAKPRALRLSGSAAPGAYDLSVGPGVVYGGNGIVYDLLNGSTPQPLGTAEYWHMCTAGAAQLDDWLLQGSEWPGQMGGIRAVRLDAQLDRNAATPFSVDAGSIDFTVGNEIVHAIEAYGNYVVTAARRDGASNVREAVLEVWDARKLRAGTGTPSFSAANKLGELVLWSFTRSFSSVNDFFQLRMSMNQGRVVVVCDDSNTGCPAVTFADLRPLMDDDATTTLSADSNQGGVEALNYPGGAALLGRVNDVTVREGRVFLTQGGSSSGALFIFDAPEAFDNDPLTKVTGTPNGYRYPVQFADSVAVYGRYAYVTPYRVSGQLPTDLAAEGITILDIGDLNAIRRIGFYPFKEEAPPSSPTGPKSPFVCGNGIRPRTHTEVRGSRLYVSTGARLDVFELE